MWHLILQSLFVTGTTENVPSASALDLEKKRNKFHYHVCNGLHRISTWYIPVSLYFDLEYHFWHAGTHILNLTKVPHLLLNTGSRQRLLARFSKHSSYSAPLTDDVMCSLQLKSLGKQDQLGSSHANVFFLFWWSPWRSCKQQIRHVHVGNACSASCVHALIKNGPVISKRIKNRTVDITNVMADKSSSAGSENIKPEREKKWL